MEQGGEWGEQFKNAKRLLAAEADKLENSIDPEWLEVDISKPIKVSKKVSSSFALLLQHGRCEVFFFFWPQVLEVKVCFE